MGGPGAGGGGSSRVLPLELERRRQKLQVTVPLKILPPVWQQAGSLHQWQPTVRPACRPCGMGLTPSKIVLEEDVVTGWICPKI
jgi:hypothetical protein